MLNYFKIPNGIIPWSLIQLWHHNLELLQVWKEWNYGIVHDVLFCHMCKRASKEKKIYNTDTMWSSLCDDGQVLNQAFESYQDGQVGAFKLAFQIQLIFKLRKDGW